MVEPLTIDEEPVSLPSSLRAALAWELREALRPPFTDLLVVAFNAALMCVAWFWLPASWQNWLFTLHGPLAFAMVLAGWMYSDVPATNVLAPDRRRVLAALDDPVMLRRLLYAKNLMLWCFVAPFCTVVAMIIGWRHHDWPPTLVSITAIAVVPFGTLGLAGCVGIRWPYHPRELRFRWEHRRQWRPKILRWITLVLVPYGLVPALALVIITPSLVLWSMLSSHGLTDKLPTTHFAGGVALAAVVSVAALVAGHRLGQWIVTRRRDELRAYLSDPDQG